MGENQDPLHMLIFIRFHVLTLTTPIVIASTHFVNSHREDNNTRKLQRTVTALDSPLVVSLHFHPSCQNLSKTLNARNNNQLHPNFESTVTLPLSSGRISINRLATPNHSILSQFRNLRQNASTTRKLRTRNNVNNINGIPIINAI